MFTKFCPKVGINYDTNKFFLTGVRPWMSSQCQDIVFQSPFFKEIDEFFRD